MTLSYCKISIKIYSLMGVVLHPLGRQRQIELCEFKTSVVYKFQASQSYITRLCIRDKTTRIYDSIHIFVELGNIKCACEWITWSVKYFVSGLVTFPTGRDWIHDCKACILRQLLFWSLWVLVLGTFQCVQLSSWVPWILTTVENSFNSSLGSSETRNTVYTEETAALSCRWTTALPERMSAQRL